MKFCLVWITYLTKALVSLGSNSFKLQEISLQTKYKDIYCKELNKGDTVV